MSRPSIWAPWRLEYIRGPKPEGCVFCRAAQEGPDREHLVLCRGRHAFVILNRYPYTAGHLMVVPCRHVADPGDLEPVEWAEVGALTVRAKAALDREFRPQGYNVGMNLGPAAGAGIADHLHLHVVPRWVGDTNFMPVLGAVGVISQHLDDIYDALAAGLRSGAGGSTAQE
ncbi:MAG: HIT family protein [Deferrisomatales bacterium]